MAEKDALKERDEKDSASEQEEEVILESEQGSQEEGEERRAGEEEDDREAIRQRRREERRIRRGRQRDKRDQSDRRVAELTRTVQTLSQRLESLQGGMVQGTRAQIDNAIRETQGQIAALRQARATAMTNLETESFDKADAALYEAQKRLDNLNARKQADAKEEPRQRETPDPLVMRNAREWVEDHDWFDPNLGDQDSRIVNAIEQQLITEGYSWRDRDFADELTDRVRKALPHHYRDDGEDDGEGDQKQERRQTRQEEAPRKRPPTMGGGRSGTDGSRGWVLSKPREEAIKAAGRWNDPAERKKAIAAYKQYDRDNPPSRY